MKDLICIDTQTCSKCNTNKELKCFSIRKDTKSGYRRDCKECQSAKKSLIYSRNKQRYNDKAKKYYEENKEDINYKKSLYWKSYYLDNKENVLEYQRKYRVKNKDCCNTRVKKWSRTDRGKSMKVLKEGKRRALKKSSCDGTVNIEAVQLLFDQQGGACNNCGLDLIEYTKHLDHIKPLSKGGPHSINNVQWLCAGCNLSKSNIY